MENLRQIVILVDEPCIREALQGAIKTELPGLVYRFEIPQGANLNENEVGIFLHERGGAIPTFIAAQDAFEKPVRVGALLERLWRHAMVRDEDIVAVFGPYELHTGEGTLMNAQADTSIRLTEKENQILKILYLAEEDAIDKETLLADVWGYQEGIETHTLETHIYRLRQKIEKDAAKPQWLVTQDDGYALKR